MTAASIGGGASLPLEGAARVIPSTRTYEVQAGDTLNGIADSFGVDVATILSNNGITNPNAIKHGVELRILPVKGVEYTVGADETLAEIAWKYQVDLGVLLDYNDLNDPDVINVGNKLVIPAASVGPNQHPLRPSRSRPPAPGPARPPRRLFARRPRRRRPPSQRPSRLRQQRLRRRRPSAVVAAMSWPTR